MPPAAKPPPLPACIWHTLVNSLELMLLFFSLGYLFIPFLFSDPVEGGLSGFLFLLVSHNLDPHVTHLQFIRGSSHPSGGSRGCLGVSDWRALTVQLNADGRGKISTGTGVCMSPTLFLFLYLRWGDRLAPANACFCEFSGQYLASATACFCKFRS